MSPISDITPTTFHIEEVPFSLEPGAGKILDEFRDIVGYFDVLFDNADDKMLDFTLTRLNKAARITFCDAPEPPKGIFAYLSLNINERRLMALFGANTPSSFRPLTESAISRDFDYPDRYPKALTNLSKWISEGGIIRKFHVVERLEKAAESLPLLFSGGNIGHLLIPSAHLSSLFR
ncbi:hypothetical protein EDB89DRAFT_2180548 [Lactarius sanguifluus]|nr:hypothetical protein EDB89DRAFT_2180548 [Lactarius sanguifluus]